MLFNENERKIWPIRPGRIRTGQSFLDQAFGIARFKIQKKNKE